MSEDVLYINYSAQKRNKMIPLKSTVTECSNQLVSHDLRITYIRVVRVDECMQMFIFSVFLPPAAL